MCVIVAIVGNVSMGNGDWGIGNGEWGLEQRAVEELVDDVAP